MAAGGGIVSSKAITLDAGGSTFLANSGTALTLSGAISGVGSHTKNGAGTLTGTYTYSGDTNGDIGKTPSRLIDRGEPHGSSAEPGLKIALVVRGAEALKSGVEFRHAWKAQLAHRRNFSRTGHPR